MQKVLRYWPVIAIYIASLTFGTFWIYVVRQVSVGHFVEGFMGCFMILFGSIKLKDLQGFVDRFAKYDLIAKWQPAYGQLFPFIEIGLGLLMLFKGGRFPEYVMVILSLLGIASVYLSIIKKQKLHCACLGTTFNVPLSYVAIFENLTMLVGAIVMIFVGHKV